ncbi:hypothetical protein OHA40_20700 [Nocardia sp. NBC_00508]|uniref:hypothetical protein n=1 Tax=Nocardia sp. NBC_00508 TaxID=2975992 RepID=UPI002E812EED|nr:hypothetical protein [Nocardia sp. NBC_00508]WUD64132.1 hypothetical protein OHA40_20700 [Nocardia sp. NBC_00508]
MVQCRMFRAAGFARPLGVLALLAGIVAMHSAVFAVSGHATAVHGTNPARPGISDPVPDPVRATAARFSAAVTATVDIARAVTGDKTRLQHRTDEPRPYHRNNLDNGRTRAEPVWTLPNHDGAPLGSDETRPHHRIESDVRIRTELVWGRPSDNGTVPGHDLHRADEGARSGNGGSVRSAGELVTRVAGGPGQTIEDAESSPPGTHAARAVTAVFAASGVPEPDCAGGGCGSAHSGIHSCVFILVVLAALAGLVLLYRMAADRAHSGVALSRHWRPRRERPPPWTVLTLAELAILRI